MTLATHTPKQSSWRVLILMPLVLAAFAALGWLSGDPLWPPENHLAILFWAFAGTSPLLAFQLGWSYELTDESLLVRRFGRLRSTHALRTFVRRDAILRLPWLEFRGAPRIWMFTGSDAAARTFLAALDRAVGIAQFGSARLVVEHVGIDALRVATAALTVPGPSCVACEREATHHLEFVVERATHYGMMHVPDDGRLGVPTCTRHRWQALMAAPVVHLAVTVTTTLVSMAVIGLGFERAGGGKVEGLLMLGLFPGAIAFNISAFAGAGRWARYRVLGLAVADVSADASTVTLRVRDAALRDRIARASEARGGR